MLSFMAKKVVVKKFWCCKTRQVFESTIKKKIWVFVNDVISEIGFWSLWLMLPGLGLNY